MWLEAVIFISFLLLMAFLQIYDQYTQTVNKPSCETRLNLLQPNVIVYETDESAPPKRVLRPIRRRQELGSILEEEKLKTGVEIGVLRGEFAKEILERWSSCQEYLLVDVWKQIVNYKDLANKEDMVQDRNYEETMRRLTPWTNKLRICRNFSVDCAVIHMKRSFDFVYVDARHDYKGVFTDLEAWWPLVNDGGIMAGHDFVTQDEGPKQTGQDWTLNYDGTVDKSGRAVYGAVIDFFNNPNDTTRYRQIVVTYQEKGWYTWMVRK